MTRTHRPTSNPRAGLRPLLPVLGMLILTAALATGCVVHPAPHHHRHARAVVVAGGHVHSAHCGHYRHRGAWYHLHGHRHGPRCGHAFVGGFWVLR